ncbi:hypothetical protein FRC08_004521 [Ceratobasidium sp. 394]|nr:hypothetical protein FRC08_004521 [Ceratobasidium sp. 394]
MILSIALLLDPASLNAMELHDDLEDFTQVHASQPAIDVTSARKVKIIQLFLFQSQQCAPPVLANETRVGTPNDTSAAKPNLNHPAPAAPVPRVHDRLAIPFFSEPDLTATRTPSSHSTTPPSLGTTSAPNMLDHPTATRCLAHDVVCASFVWLTHTDTFAVSSSWPPSKATLNLNTPTWSEESIVACAKRFPAAVDTRPGRPCRWDSSR